MWTLGAKKTVDKAETAYVSLVSFGRFFDVEDPPTDEMSIYGAIYTPILIEYGTTTDNNDGLSAVVEKQVAEALNYYLIANVRKSK